MIKNYVRTHKLVASGAALAVICIGWLLFGGSSATAQTRYVFGTVTKGTLTVAVSGAGQIQPSNQISVHPKTSADVTAIPVKAGQTIVVGQPLVYLDSQDAQGAVRNAQIALQNAQITLQKLQQDQTITASSSTENLVQAYADAFNDISGTFLQLPGLMDIARGILYDDTLKSGCSPNTCGYTNLVSDATHNQLLQAITQAESDYTTASASYTPTFTRERTLRHDASHDQVYAMLQETTQTVELVAQTVKSEQNMLDIIVNDITTQATIHNTSAKIPTQIATYQSNIGTAIGSLNSLDSQLVTAQRNIQNSQQTVQSATLTNPLDLSSQGNTVAQREDDLRNAQQALANCTVRSLIAGVVANVNVKVGDAVGTGTTVATIISKAQQAVIPLNEVDVASVQLGQKATFTFDAVQGLTMTGTIVGIDSLGTTTQGVVNYNVTIALDTQDARVRPGMSLNADIITNSVLDTLIVPSSAVKTASDGSSSVQELDATTNTPKNVTVTIGISNNTETQILSGLSEGDTIITRTVTGTTPATSTIPTSGGSRSIIGGGAAGAILRGN